MTDEIGVLLCTLAIEVQKQRNPMLDFVVLNQELNTNEEKQNGRAVAIEC